MLQLFCPSWWESALWFQWYKFTGKLWLVTSNTLQMFQSHFEKAYIIGPRLAASTHEVIFICRPAGRFVYPFCYLSFFFCIIVNILFLSQVRLGNCFIPFVQLCKRLCKRIEKWLNLQSCKAKLLLHMIDYVLVVINGKDQWKDLFFQKGNSCFVSSFLFSCHGCSPFYQVTLASIWLLFLKGSFMMRGYTFYMNITLNCSRTLLHP